MTTTANTATPRIPSLTFHKPTGQGYVRLNGRCIYLGRYDQPETHQKYHQTIAEWVAGNGQFTVCPADVTVTELCAKFLAHAEKYYVRPTDGKPTGQLNVVKNCIKGIKTLYGLEPAKEFGPVKLRTVRQTWIDAKLSRKTINMYVAQVKYMFKWAVSYEMVPGTVHHALNALDGLRHGRSDARETDAVQPVPQAHIDAVRANVSRPVRALIDLQLVCGARSGELLGLRPIDLDTKGPVWTVRLDQHKTAYKGRERFLYFGPKAQAIIKPFLQDRPVHLPLFSPKEAEAERHAAKPTHRHQPVKTPKTARTVRDRYTSESYRRAIEYACINTKTPHWHPHQLRHNFATEVRREHGLEMAQILCGHATADVTQVYAEVDRARAIQLIEQIG